MAMANFPQSGEVAEIIPHSDLIKIIECPVCTSIPYPPIYGCVNGHIACNTCRPRLHHCSICRQPFWEGRNYILESIVAGTKFHCNYKDAGCKEVVVGDKIKNHLMSCKFGPMFSQNTIITPPCITQWIKCSNGELPENAVIGSENEFEKLYVARANHEGGKIPGHYSSVHKVVHIPWGERVHIKTEYEILVGNQDFLIWRHAEYGLVPPQAIEGGPSESGEMLFIGRWPIGGSMVIGKVHPSHGGCYVPYEDHELVNRQYEVLVRNVNITDPLHGNDSSQGNRYRHMMISESFSD